MNDQLSKGCKRGLKIRVSTDVGVQLIINIIETGDRVGLILGWVYWLVRRDYMGLFGRRRVI